MTKMPAADKSHPKTVAKNVRTSPLPLLAVGSLFLIGVALILNGAFVITPQAAFGDQYGGTAIAPQRDPSHWPHDSASGRLKQLGEYPSELTLNPSLYYLNDLPSGKTPTGDIVPLGIQIATPDEAGRLAFETGWRLLDARTPEDFLNKGIIPSAACHPYSFEGAQVKSPRIALTRDVANRLLDDHPGLVVYCNGPGCRRSYNACIALVQQWNIDPKRIRWLRQGVVGWKRTLLTPIDLTLSAASEESP